MPLFPRYQEFENIGVKKFKLQRNIQFQFQKSMNFWNDKVVLIYPKYNWIDFEDNWLKIVVEDRSWNSKNGNFWKITIKVRVFTVITCFFNIQNSITSARNSSFDLVKSIW